MEINIVIMNKLLFCFIAIFAVIGIIACFHACQTYFKASELEFQNTVKRTSFSELDSLPPPVRDTIELREFLPR